MGVPARIFPLSHRNGRGGQGGEGKAWQPRFLDFPPIPPLVRPQWERGQGVRACLGTTRSMLIRIPFHTPGGASAQIPKARQTLVA